MPFRTTQRKIVLAAAGGLTALWFVLNFNSLAAAGQDSIVRFLIGTVFAAMVLFRPKAMDSVQGSGFRFRRKTQSSAVADRGYRSRILGFSHFLWPPSVRAEDFSAGSGFGVQGSGFRSAPILAAIGVLLWLGGAIFGVHQFSWLGLLLLLFACLRWALPAEYARDILLSLLLFYLAHPLPGQIFGPLQLAMQKLSVHGSEWLLQAVNTRVWADGMTLRAGFRTFGVPESCSGMSAATTVFLTGLGTGLLFRFKWHETACLTILGLLQTLLLNILRISSMALIAPRMPPEWGDSFLHDTLGVFLLLAIVIVQVEALLWRLYCAAPRDEYAGFWRGFFRRSSAILFVLLILGATAFLAFKRRPYHRAVMIGAVAEELMHTDIEAADRASAAALRLASDNDDLRAQRAQILVQRCKFEEALIELGKLPERGRVVLHTVLRALSLTGLNRYDEAAALIDTLPERNRNVPGVAMARTELAAADGDIEGVAGNIVKAANSDMFIGRVRALFPYLAAHARWDTIADCRSDIPHTQLSSALTAIHAHLKVNDVSGAGRMIEHAINRWPDEPEFVKYLAAIAEAEPGGEWERFFAQRLLTKLDAFDADELSLLIDSSFRLSRPDLAWAAYRRLREIDPLDPALLMAPVKFGDVWFTFRKHHVGMSAGTRHETIGLAEFYRKMRNWTEAPLAAELTTGDSSEKRNEYLSKCLKEYERRDRQKRLSPRMRMEYADALDARGRDGEAHLQRLAAKESYAGTKADITLAIAAIDDYRKQNDPAGLTNALTKAIATRPDEPQFVKYLAGIAEKQPGSQWEVFFEKNLFADLETDYADKLAAHIESAFRLSRPDLAWRAYNRLREIDPRDPALYFAPARFGKAWFTFYGRHVGIRSRSEDGRSDLAAVYLESRNWPEAPLAHELSGGDMKGKRDEWLRKCLAELTRRKEMAGLSPRMWMMYTEALNLAGRHHDAHAALDAVERALPFKKPELLLERAAMYQVEGQWESLYETIKQFFWLTDNPQLPAGLMQVNALIHLDMGAHALAVARKVLKAFPHAPQARLATAAVWHTYGFSEDALFALADEDAHFAAPMLVELLSKTERFSEAALVSRTHGVKIREPRDNNAQRVLFSPIEQSLAGRFGPPLAEADMDRDAARLLSELSLRQNGTPSLPSPYVLGLRQLMLEWRRNRGEGAVSDPSRWAAVGRDNLEKGMALYELAMLMARQKKYAEADRIAVQALELVPDSVMLWRARIALSGMDAQVISRARQACPQDSEVWLAWLISNRKLQQALTKRETTRLGEAPAQRRSGYAGSLTAFDPKRGAEFVRIPEQAGIVTDSAPKYDRTSDAVHSPDEQWFIGEIEKAVAEESHAIAAFVRAGDFMLRHGMPRAASLAAQHAVKKGRGMLPAYLLGLRCALQIGDTNLALSYALGAVDHAVNPTPFLMTAAEIADKARSSDMDTVAVLEKLMAAFPKDARWASRLGDIYLKRGDPKRAAKVLGALVGTQADSADLRALLAAAEAARRDGDHEKATAILEDAYAAHPDSPAALNNLVYALALDRQTLPRSQQLLAWLLEVWGDSFAALDTAAVVCRNSGEIDKAAEYLKKAAECVGKTNQEWFDLNPTAMDLDVYLGKSDDRLDRGLNELEALKRSAQRDSLIPLARELAGKVRERATTLDSGFRVRGSGNPRDISPEP